MKMRNLLLLLSCGLLFFSCTETGIERPAARIRFNILPERINPGQYDFPEKMYRDFAEMIYLDSVMLPALRAEGIAVNSQTAKVYRDSILIVRTPGSYGNSEHDLVVWQTDEEKALRLVNALYDRMVEYYKQTKGNTESGSENNLNETENGETGTSNITELSNRLANIERRMEAYASDADSVRILEEEKQAIIAQFSTEVETQSTTSENAYETDGTPYVKYYDAERLGPIQMPRRKK